jgi:hypothetical protein
MIAARDAAFAERDQLAARNAKLEHILAEIRRAHFGRKSERISDVGWKPWRGAEIWVNPEMDQGFGLSGTLGVATHVCGHNFEWGSRIAR